jgi:hypothetical protein
VSITPTGTGPANPYGAGPRTVLIVHGGDRVYEGSKPGRVRFIGISDVEGLLPENVPTKRLGLGVDLEPMLVMLRQQSGGGDLSAFACVLNLVSEPDHSPNTLEALQLLLRGYRGRVINRPEAVLRTSRDQVANVLSGIPGLHVPRIVRFRGGDADAAFEAVIGACLVFPLIVRGTATHRGRSMVLVENEIQFRAAVAGDGEYYAIEFVDYRSADGLYRKYRMWSFGGRQVFRHLAPTDHWIVHVTPGNEYMIDRPDLIAEEVRLMERVEGDFPDEVHAVVAEIGERLALDCFGVDFAFHPDGRMVLFEANAAMSFFPLVVDPRFGYRQKLFAPAQEAFMATLGLRE